MQLATFFFFLILQLIYQIIFKDAKFAEIASCRSCKLQKLLKSEVHPKF